MTDQNAKARMAQVAAAARDISYVDLRRPRSRTGCQVHSRPPEPRSRHQATPDCGLTSLAWPAPMVVSHVKNWSGSHSTTRSKATLD